MNDKSHLTSKPQLEHSRPGRIYHDLRSASRDYALAYEKNTKPNERDTLPEAVALYVAQVPVVYHVPALIKHPLLELPTYACK
jgi:hypothetical protein